MNNDRFWELTLGASLDATEDTLQGKCGFINSWLLKVLVGVLLLLLVLKVLFPSFEGFGLFDFIFVVSSVVLCAGFAYGRETTIDFADGDIRFVRSLFGIPFSEGEATLRRIGKEDESRPYSIYAETEQGDRLPLFRAHARFIQKFDEQWEKVINTVPVKYLQEDL